MNQTNLDRLPPHSLDAERGLLGCALLDPETLDRAAEAGVEPESFYDLRNREVFAELVAMRAQGKPIDPVTLGERLLAAGALDRVGGLANLASLPDSAPVPSNAPYWLGIIREVTTKRRMLAVFGELSDRVRNCDGDPAGILEDAEREILKIGDAGPGREVDGKALAGLAIDELQARIEGGNAGLGTGFRDLDKATLGGLRPGCLYVIAGRPGLGKTALGLGIPLAVAARGIPVGFFSLEMSAAELAERCLANLSELPVTKFDSEKKPDPGQEHQLKVAGSRLAKLPVTVDDTPDRTVGQVRAIARRWKSRKKVGLIVIDYLQLLGGDRGAGKERREVVDAISRGLKCMAKELQLPVIALCQLNRDFEKDTARKPRLSDLRESGAIEQDADLVGILYEPKPDTEEQPDPNVPKEVRLLIVKQRRGPKMADLRFLFRGEVTRFESMTNRPDHSAR
jgi:replicative DNA helicase